MARTAIMYCVRLQPLVGQSSFRELPRCFREQLRLVLGAVVVFEKLLKDAILSSEGEAWQTATATYSVLRRAAKTRPTLAAELVPVETWFRNAHRGSKAVASASASSTARSSDDNTSRSGDSSTQVSFAWRIPHRKAPAARVPARVSPQCSRRMYKVRCRRSHASIGGRANGGGPARRCSW